jgi:hypothetical protein
VSGTDDPQLPFDRASLFEIPPVYQELREAGSIVRVRTPVGLHVAFETPFSRLPGLRLAIPAEEIQPRNDELTGGVMELPVAWVSP